MAQAYVIQWKSKVNGRAGRGTKLLELEEARSLVLELNADYPDIHHEPVPANVEIAVGLMHPLENTLPAQAPPGETGQTSQPEATAPQPLSSLDS